MLYIFSVEQGTMLTFDMDLACQSVMHLKTVIEQTQDIPADKQVLLISGGECLNSSNAVSSYGAGTETNPIYLFNRKLHEIPEGQTATSDAVKRYNPHSERFVFVPDAMLRKKVEQALSLGPSVDTLRTRTQLASEIFSNSQTESKLSKERVHEQHIQQQAWCAVIANLEDAVDAFKKKATSFSNTYQDFLNKQDQFKYTLSTFAEDSRMLAKVPLLEKLTQTVLENQHPDPVLQGCPATLLDYVLRSDPSGSLETLAESCVKGLSQMAPEVFKELQVNVDDVVQRVDQEQFKQIKGLESRFSGLEELLSKSEKILSYQDALHQQFQNIYTKTVKLRESERGQMIPDICATHVAELRQMYANFNDLRDIARRCAHSKDELADNIKFRLSYITKSEQQVSELSFKLTAYEKRIQCLLRDMAKIEQIHSAPEVYARSIAEVVRRKQFSNLFLKWAGTLSNHCKEIYRQEVEHRKNYNASIRCHFIRSLFPGLEDLPPPFAIKNPKLFDERLPPVDMNDVEALKKSMPPVLASLLETSTSAPSLSFMEIDSHMSSDISKKTESDTVSNQGVRIFDSAGSPDTGYITDNSNNVTMEVACASETKMCVDANDDREKLRACVVGLRETVGAFACDTNGLAQDVTRWTGELVDDAQKVQETIVNVLGELTKQRHELKAQLDVEKHKLGDAQGEIDRYYEEHKQMRELQEKLKHEFESKTKEYTAHITQLELQHALDMDKFENENKQLIQQLQGQLADLQQEIRVVRHEKDEHKLQIQKMQTDWENRIAQANEEYCRRETAIREELDRHHKSEIESLRCRYRLNSSVMSDSGTSPPGGTVPDADTRWKQREIELLEKISALEAEVREKNDGSPVVASMEMDSNATGAGLSQSMLESQYRVLSESQALIESTFRLQSPNANTESLANDLEEQIRAKELELQRLQVQYVAMCGSGSVPSLSCDRVSILSCCKGDIVLLTYDDTYENYVIFMLGPLLHFLHKDSLEAMRLSTAREKVTRTWIIGEVVDREFCEARRLTNRYKVAVGTRFFRVKVRPWDRQGAAKREQERRQVLRQAAAVAAAAGGNPLLAVSSPVSSPATSI